MTTTGALNTASVVVTSPIVCFPLPVSWIYFNGKAVERNVLLEWATANEINNDYFTIEKSKDGSSFDLLTIVDASANANAEHSYSFTDVMPYSNSYYRISQTDQDGKTLLYKTIQVVQNNTDMSVIPYVNGNQIAINTSGLTAGSGSILVYSLDGKKLLEQKVELTSQAATYTLNVPFHQGMYLIKMMSDHQTIYNGKILVK